MKRVTVAVAAVIGIGIGAAGPASATIEVRDAYSEVFSDTFSDCGIDTIAIDHEAHGIFMARAIKQSDGTAWLGHDNYSAVDVFTNPANGKTFSLSYNGNFREIRGTRIEGDVWRFEWKDSGATWVLRDGSGRLVWRDRGTISGADVIDTLGDDQLGGELISSDITSLKGKFAAFRWCEDIVVPMLG